MASNKGKSFKSFINESEVAFDEETPQEETPIEPTEGDMPEEGEETEDPQPEIIKVYSDSEEDMLELEEAGIELEDGILPEDGFYIKVKTLEGTEEILLFKEKDPESRIPVTDEEAEMPAEGEEGAEMPVEEEQVQENEEFQDDAEMPAEEGAEMPAEGEEPTDDVASQPGRFDTELVAQHGDNEYVISAEIEVAEDGDIENMDVNEEEPVEVQDPEEDEMATEDTEEEEKTPAVPMTESRKVLGFSDFLKKK